VTPKISLLLMTYNRKGAAARCFRSLLPAIERPDVETLILDNASADGCQDYMYAMVNWWRRTAAVHLWLSAANMGVAGGRNFLMSKAQGDIFVILDSDVIAQDDGWLEQLIEPLNKPEVGIAGPAGHWIPVDPAGNWQWFQPVRPGYVGEVDTVSGYCQAFRRKVWDDGFRIDEYYNPYWHDDTQTCLAIKESGLAVWCDSTLPLMHIYAGSGDDGRGREKFKHLEGTFKGKGLIRGER
jgi:GT2 family glycosyltransferase